MPTSGNKTNALILLLAKERIWRYYKRHSKNYAQSKRQIHIRLASCFYEFLGLKDIFVVCVKEDQIKIKNKKIINKDLKAQLIFFLYILELKILILT